MGIMWLEYNTTQVIENIYSHALFIKNNAHDNLFHKSNNKYIEWET